MLFHAHTFALFYWTGLALGEVDAQSQNKEPKIRNLLEQLTREIYEEDKDETSNEQSGVWESSHPYENNQYNIFERYSPAGKILRLSFSQFDTEQGWDSVALTVDGVQHLFSGQFDPA